MNNFVINKGNDLQLKRHVSQKILINIPGILCYISTREDIFKAIRASNDLN